MRNVKKNTLCTLFVNFSTFIRRLQNILSSAKMFHLLYFMCTN